MKRRMAMVLGPVVAALGIAAPSSARADVQCAPPGTPWPGTPWQQQVLTPERVRPFADGSGVVVAVLSTGVDATQPQLAGSVEPGYDAVAGHGAAHDDCVGIGTAVAGAIAAHAGSGSGSVAGIGGVVGLAPNARILPVRVSDGSGQADQGTDPSVLAAGITFAVLHGAAIVDVAEPAYRSSPELSAAVALAAQRNVVLVVAAGVAAASGRPAVTPVPAWSAGSSGIGGAGGTLVVGALDSNGRRWSSSPVGSFIGLAAPGVATVCLARGGGVAAIDGTDVASGFVAGTAALVVQRRPQASAGAVVGQLMGTATPVAGPGSTEYGHGMVNPYSAVTAALVPARTGSVVAAERTAPPPPAPTDRHTLALALTAIALIAALTVALGRPVALRGRRSRWRASTAGGEATWAAPGQAGAPVDLFQGLDTES
ncbi:membrane-anchored mycosin MYCP [Catenulispora sp. GAS73]|uniref:S8 family serine peptidase n=1 Tax=Catenulispora sp. GAS73 TaxID=3156269 RepID=UPI0035164640